MYPVTFPVPKLLVHLSILAKTSDSQPLEDELKPNSWIQLGRWIKYEEKVEQDAERLGNPQIPIITYHSVQCFRDLLARNGNFMADLPGTNIEDIMNSIMESFDTDQIQALPLPSQASKVKFLRNVLLANHYTSYTLKTRRHSIWGIGDGIRNLRRNSILIGASYADDSENFRTQDQQQKRRKSSPSNDKSLPIVEQQELKSFLGNIRRDSEMLKFQKNSSSNARPSVVSTDGNIKWIDGETGKGQGEVALVLVGQNVAICRESISFVRLSEGVFMPELAECSNPIRFICLVLVPADGSATNLKEMGRSIATLLSNPDFQSTIYNAKSKQDVLTGIDHFLGNSLVIPPGNWDPERFPFNRLKTLFTDSSSFKKQLKLGSMAPESVGKITKVDSSIVCKEMVVVTNDAGELGEDKNPLQRTRTPFGGLRAEIRNRFPLYWSDLKDGFNMQCVATIIFIYFACISGNIAFGGLMSTKTDNYIGISETLMGAAVGGTIFALFSAQPLLIVGTTGPCLVFDESLFKLCKSFEMTGDQFLIIRAWIGIWLGIIALLFTYFDGSCLLKFFTRFTQEIFATLISFVFIAESVKSLLEIYKQHPLLESYEPAKNESYLLLENGPAPASNLRQPNVALLSTILMFGTYFIATWLKEFRSSGFFNSMIRNAIANFAVLFSIIAMGLLDWSIQTTNTPKLKLPDASDGLKNSHENRTSWFINPIADLETTSYWIIPLTAIPAFLLFIFVFMETGIAELIVDKKESKLKKGCGYHLNVLLMCVLNSVMGLFGLGWVSAPTIRSVTHVSALTVYSVNNVPGEKPETVGILEQRVTGLCISFILGISVLMADVLIFVPLAVLFGIFLYMGITSLNGIQLIDRTGLLFKPIELHPQIGYVLNVRRWKMVTFTLTQLGCFGILWFVKESPASLSLALLILLLVPFRFCVLKHWFTQSELSALDGSGGNK